MLLKNTSLKTLEKKYKSEKNFKVKQRLHILLLLREGYSQREVARMVHVSNGLVSFWKGRFESEGFNGITDKIGRGIKPQLTEEDLSMMASEIDAGILMEDGYRRGWKTKDTIQFINTHFMISYTSRHCRRILKKIDCSQQVPRTRNKRRNQEDVDEFKHDFKKKEKVWAIT